MWFNWKWSYSRGAIIILYSLLVSLYSVVSCWLFILLHTSEIKRIVNYMTYIGNQTHHQSYYLHQKSNESSILSLLFLLLLTPESNRVVSSFMPFFYIRICRYVDVDDSILIQKVYWKSNTSVCNLWIHPIYSKLHTLYHTIIQMLIIIKFNANSLFGFNVATWYFFCFSQTVTSMSTKAISDSLFELVKIA